MFSVDSCKPTWKLIKQLQHWVMLSLAVWKRLTTDKRWHTSFLLWSDMSLTSWVNRAEQQQQSADPSVWTPIKRPAAALFRSLSCRQSQLIKKQANYQHNECCREEKLNFKLSQVHRWMRKESSRFIKSDKQYWEKLGLNKQSGFIFPDQRAKRIIQKLKQNINFPTTEDKDPTFLQLVSEAS